MDSILDLMTRPHEVLQEVAVKAFQHYSIFKLFPCIIRLLNYVENAIILNKIFSSNL